MRLFLRSGRRRTLLSSVGKVPKLKDVYPKFVNIGAISCMASLSSSIGTGSSSQLF